MSLVARGRICLPPPPGGVSPTKGLLSSSPWSSLILSATVTAPSTATSSTVSTLAASMVSAVALITSTTTPTIRLILGGCTVGASISVCCGGQILGQLDHLGQLAVVSPEHVE